MDNRKIYSNSLQRIKELKAYFSREVPVFLKQLNDDRVPDIDSMQTFASNSASFSDILRNIQHIAEEENLFFARFSEIETYLDRKIATSHLAAFLSITANDQDDKALLQPHSHRLCKTMFGLEDDPEFKKAVLIFIKMVKNVDADIPDEDLYLLDRIFGRCITRKLDRGVFYFAEENSTVNANADNETVSGDEKTAIAEPATHAAEQVNPESAPNTVEQVNPDSAPNTVEQVIPESTPNTVEQVIPESGKAIILESAAKHADSNHDDEDTTGLKSVPKNAPGSDTTDEHVSKPGDDSTHQLKLDPLAQNNRIIDVKDGIFQNVEVPDQGTINEVYRMITEDSIPSALLYANSLRRSDRSFWGPIYQAIAYVFNDPLADCEYSSMKINEIFSNSLPNASREAQRRFEISTFLRLLSQEKLDKSELYLLKGSQVCDLFNDCELFTSCKSVAKVIVRFCEYFQRVKKGFGPDAISAVKNANQSAERYASLQRRATSLLMWRLDETNTHHPVVKSLRTRLFGLNGTMTKLVQPVANGDTENLSEGKAFLERFLDDSDKTVISKSKIGDYIDEMWISTGKSFRHRPQAPLLDHEKTPISNNIMEFLQVFYNWVNDDTQKDNNIEFKMQIEAHLQKNVSDAIREVERVPSGTLAENAGRMAVMTALRDILSMLVSGKNDRKYYYLDFVTTDEVELDPETCMPILDEYVSIIPGFELWNRVLAHDKKRISLDAYLGQVFEKNQPAPDLNFGRPTLLLNYLRPLPEFPGGITMDSINACMDRLHGDMNSMRSYIEKESLSFQAEMEMSEGFGRFAELGMKDRILREFADWHRPFADYSVNVGFYKRKMNACIAEVAKASRVLEQEYLERLEVLRKNQGSPVNPESGEQNNDESILDTIEDLISKQIYSVADDYMSLAEKGYTVNPTSFMTTGQNTDYFSQFKEKHKELNAKYGYHASMPLYDVYTRENPELSDSNKQMKSARFMLRHWPKSSLRDNQDDSLCVYLTEMGFPVKSISPSTLSRDDKILKEVTMSSETVAEDKHVYPHPIADFGSKLVENGMLVQLIFGRADRELIMDTIKRYGYTGKPVMILLDYALSIEERSAIAHRQRIEGVSGRTVVLIDRLLAVHLASIAKGERIKAMLQCTLPFQKIIPYYLNSTTEIPPDMFMGRRDELSSIISPGGTHIIYGGRQLGKTALLQRARKEFDNRQDEDHWGIYITIRKKSYDVLPPVICAAMRQEGFFPEDAQANTWEELCALIMKRIDSGKTKLLLLLDEADTMLSTSEKASYDVVQQLVQLRESLGDRFKFVLAGLHNVVRFSKDALKNNRNGPRLAPLCIKPLKYSEASELIEKPLFYLGYRTKKEHTMLISQILSSCNYYPGLIHYYAHELLTKMEQNMGYDDGMPPHYLDEAQIRKLLKDASFNAQVKDKLLMTLGVDEDEGNYYSILAYALAYLFHENRNNPVFGFSAREMMRVCADFSIESIGRLGENMVNALLEELLDLNVLRSSDSYTYSFNRRSFLEMLGNEETVYEELEKFSRLDS